MNDNYATRGGLLKVARMTDGEEFLGKKAIAEFAPSATGMTRMEAVALADSLPF